MHISVTFWETATPAKLSIELCPKSENQSVSNCYFSVRLRLAILKLRIIDSQLFYIETDFNSKFKYSKGAQGLTV